MKQLEEMTDEELFKLTEKYKAGMYWINEEDYAEKLEEIEQEITRRDEK